MTAPEGIRVLVADDDPDIRDLVEFKLDAGRVRRARGAPTASGAWEAFAGPDPAALAMLDVMMPGLSGIDVAAQDPREPATPAVPVAAAEREGAGHDVETGFAIGADDYVVKPFSPRELLTGSTACGPGRGDAPARCSLAGLLALGCCWPAVR